MLPPVVSPMTTWVMSIITWLEFVIDEMPAEPMKFPAIIMSAML
jgi:hypothetical protein